MDRHTKAFGIYHWDTFEDADDDTMLVGEADTVVEARLFILDKYGDCLRFDGADRLDIVIINTGEIIEQYAIG